MLYDHIVKYMTKSRKYLQKAMPLLALEGAVHARDLSEQLSVGGVLVGMGQQQRL